MNLDAFVVLAVPAADLLVDVVAVAVGDSSVAEVALEVVVDLDEGVVTWAAVEMVEDAVTVAVGAATDPVSFQTSAAAVVAFVSVVVVVSVAVVVDALALV